MTLRVSPQGANKSFSSRDRRTWPPVYRLSIEACTRSADFNDALAADDGIFTAVARGKSGAAAAAAMAGKAGEKGVGNRSRALRAAPMAEAAAPPAATGSGASELRYCSYENEEQLVQLTKLIEKDLSEPYSVYTYR